MDGYKYWLISAGFVVVILIMIIDILYERRQIARYLRIGGARILKFRWRPFLGYSQNFLGFCAWPEIALRRRAEVGQGKIRHNSHRASRCSAFGTYSVFASTHLAGRQGDL